MRAKETFDSSWAEWREDQVRAAVEGDARLRQTQLAQGERPHLPDGSAVMDLKAVERVHQPPWETAPIQELPPK